MENRQVDLAGFLTVNLFYRFVYNPQEFIVFVELCTTPIVGMGTSSPHGADLYEQVLI